MEKKKKIVQPYKQVYALIRTPRNLSAPNRDAAGKQLGRPVCNLTDLYCTSSQYS